MRKLIALIFFLTTVTSSFAHAGHIHTYMGTVTMLHGEHSFMMKTTDGKDLTIETSAKTKWKHADGHVAKSTELKVDDRVVVKMMMDDKTAAEVKIAAPKK